MTVKNGISQTWSLPEWWDGYRYSDAEDRPAFSPPTSVSVTPSGTTNGLTWANGVVSAQTRIWRSNTQTGTYALIYTADAGATSYNNTGLVNGTYWYKLQHILNENVTDLTTAVSGVITGGSSSLVDGANVTVTIPGAGSNVDPANQEFLGGSGGVIESAADGAVFNTFMPSGWGMPGGTGARISTTRALNGTKSLLNNRSLGYQFGIRFDMGAEQGAVRVVWTYYMHNPADVPMQLKQQRFVGSLLGGSGGIGDGDIANCYITSSDSNSAGASERIPVNNSAGNVAISSESSGFAPGYTGTWYGQGFWVRNEVSLIRNSADNVADGRLVIVSKNAETNEVIGHRVVPNYNFTSTDDFIRYLAWQGYMGNFPPGTPSEDVAAIRLYLDRDWYAIWNSSRVVPKIIQVGDASTYAACETLIDQPFSTWTDVGGDAQVNFDFNQGRLPTAAGWVYALSDVDTPINTTGVPL